MDDLAGGIFTPLFMVGTSREDRMFWSKRLLPGRFAGRFFIITAILASLNTGCWKGEQEAPSEERAEQQTEELYQALQVARPLEAVIAIDDLVVTKQELRDQFLELYENPKSSVSAEEAATRVLERVLKINYVYLQAVQEGFESSPDFNLEWDFKTSMWVGNLMLTREMEQVELQEEVYEAAIPSDLVALKLHQITMQDLIAAQDIRVRAQEGEDFEDLARKYSTDPTAPRGGVLAGEQIMRISETYDLDTLRIIANHDVGEITRPLSTGLGYTIFRLDAQRPLSESERKTLREDLLRRVKSEAEVSFRQHYKELYPLNVDEKKLLLLAAGKTGDGDIVATVGDFRIEVSFLHVASRFGQRIEDKTRVHEWRGLLAWLHGPLSLYEGAKASGVMEDEVVKENIARVAKYNLSKTMLKNLGDSISISDQEVFERYLRENMLFDEEGVFSIEGVLGLGREEAERLAAEVKTGDGSVVETANRLGMKGTVYEGTYRGEDFDEEIILALEKTPAGNLTGTVPAGKGYALFKVLGKSRGEALPFDTYYRGAHRKLYGEKLFAAQEEIVVRQHTRTTLRYIHDKASILRLLVEYYRLQMALGGVSPPGGWHGGGQGPH